MWRDDHLTLDQIIGQYQSRWEQGQGPDFTRQEREIWALALILQKLVPTKEQQEEIGKRVVETLNKLRDERKADPNPVRLPW